MKNGRIWCNLADWWNPFNGVDAAGSEDGFGSVCMARRDRRRSLLAAVQGDTHLTEFFIYKSRPAAIRPWIGRAGMRSGQA